MTFNFNFKQYIKINQNELWESKPLRALANGQQKFIFQNLFRRVARQIQLIEASVRRGQQIVGEFLVHTRAARVYLQSLHAIHAWECFEPPNGDFARAGDELQQ